MRAVGAESDLPTGTTTFDCWRCSEHVEAAGTTPGTEATVVVLHRRPGWPFSTR
jgi:hypothetical protein